MPIAAQGESPIDPSNVVPSTTSSDYQIDGVFGKSPKYAPATIEMINYTYHYFLKALSYKYPLNVFHYGISEGTTEKAFSIIGEKLNNLPPSEFVLDLFAYGQASGSAQFAFDVTGEHLRDYDISGLDSANWATANPTTLAEAVDRMAQLLKTLNSATPIP
jgi:hypothetical protein